MQSTTKAIINAALQSDQSLSATRRKQLVAVLENEGNGVINPTAIPRVIRRKEVASLLGVSEKRVDQICNGGGLTRVRSPGASRAMGFSEASVRALVEGRAVRA